MGTYTLGLHEVNKSSLSVVGGKGANLGELLTIEGIQVPGGFCISTNAFKENIGHNKEFHELLSLLANVKANDTKRITGITAKIRNCIEGIPVLPEISNEIENQLKSFSANDSFAVRSSATAEDLPTASFAGQQDTYLNVASKEAIIKSVRKCWASLFTDRAVIYRIQNGFPHGNVHLSVIIQKMVFPQASGILFTADPVTGNRKVLSIDASYGLGEALVAGIVNADNYKVKGSEIIDKKILQKKISITALPAGGTKKEEVLPEKQHLQTLSGEQILRLAAIGRKIEAHFGSPQDVEWCLADDTFYIVQSRPITTLYPVPTSPVEGNRVFISVGHQQMMTDAMKPLGLSLWQLTSFAPMQNAGGRLFVDMTNQITSPETREGFLNSMGHHDPLIKDALMNLIERGGFIDLLPGEEKKTAPVKSEKDSSTWVFKSQVENDPTIVADLVNNSRASVAELKQNIQAKSGTALFDFILEDDKQFKKSLFEPKNIGVIMNTINASIWLNEKMYEWLGEKNVADVISQSVPNNITAEMGLELLDVADVVRHYPEIIKYLKNAKEENFLDELVKFEGGEEVRRAIADFLSKYGMRCAGEIDITRTRWSEKPGILIAMLLGNIKNVAPHESKRKFEQGKKESLKKEEELIERLKQLPAGEQKAEETKRVISLIRNFTGYREYPKYNIVNRSFIYKQALMKEAELLVQANVIRHKEDVYYLSFNEFREAVRTGTLNYQVITQRKEEYRQFEKLSPPRVITSDGEILTGKYKRENLPSDAIIGLPVSSGTIEGRARVILNIEDAVLEEGDILVTTFTDPSWTPLFVSIKGLVTEVGGLMTHGAVIAREYGLPAVVGVEHVTKLIKDGQRIRVNGTDGYVEVLK